MINIFTPFLYQSLTFSSKVIIGKPKFAPKGPPITLTESAVKRVQYLIDNHKKALKEEPETLGIRLSIKTKGCSGLAYTMDYDTQAKKFDEVVQQDGITIFVEPKALMHVAGSVMDWVEDKISAEFVFHNPNAKSVCGCGHSFQT